MIQPLRKEWEAFYSLEEKAAPGKRSRPKKSFNLSRSRIPVLIGVFLLAYMAFSFYSQFNKLANMHNDVSSIQQQMKDMVLQSRRPNDSAKRPYDDELVPAVTTTKTTGGVEWKAYKGDFLWVPDVAILTPSETGTSDRPNTTVNNKADFQTLFFTGYIKIPADGEYTFFLNTDQGAFLRIHDAAVIDADFGYTSGTERKGAINLKAGLHPFKLYYTNKTGIKPLLNFQWSSSSISKQPVPSSAFIRNAKI